MNDSAVAPSTATTGREHWTRKGDVRLFLWQKPPAGGASFQQKNYQTAYHILHSFFAQPEPVYRGG
jgi:hypothetical protein